MRRHPPPLLLREFFLRLILSRVFLPLLAVGLISAAGVGLLARQNLLNQQKGVVETVSQIVDLHIEQGGRVLDVIAHLAEDCGAKGLGPLIESTWQAYGQFETIYCLDRDNRIRLIMPPTHDHSGLDMSNLPDFKNYREEQNPRISRPFISIRTGEPTIYLVRSLTGGGAVVGELNLAFFQKTVDRISRNSDNDFVFITSQHGTLLAHPDVNQVRQQVNVSNLGIFKRIQAGETTAFYPYQDIAMIGSVAREQQTGWLVVDQTPLSAFLLSYVWIILLILAATAVVWIALSKSLREQIQHFLISPLEQLGHDASALSRGDYSRLDALSAIPVSCIELRQLLADFHAMSATLKIRDEALACSEKLYRTLTENHPDGIVRLNAECRHLFANTSALRNAGLTTIPVIGKTLGELPLAGNPETTRPLVDICRKVVQTAQPETLEFIWPNGRVSEVRHIPELDEYGKVSSVLALSRDVSEQKRVATALLESERRFRTLAENMPDYVVRYDTQCRHIYKNAAIVRTLAGAAMAGPSQAPTTYVADRTGTIVTYKEVLRRVISTGEPASIIVAYDEGPFDEQIHSIRLVAERDDSGTIISAIAIGRDITRIKETERQAKESRDKLRELVARNTSAREDERKSIAREIHDELGQMLTALRLDIAILKLLYGRENAALEERCQHLVELVDQTIQIVRDVAIALRPAVLDMGTASALEWLTNDFMSRSGVDCRLHLNETEMIFDEHRSIALFRIVQESLTNVARHSGARQVDISFDRDGNNGRLAIRDNGKGFDPESVREKSLGLIGIEERALMIGGEARFISAPGQGTTILITFSL